mmetsp:Transcript_38093/g.121048  ORF Transcript_38093/g.121048 Transcript_38093/m.121048 type:complete len:214 (+) Transcript_38093:312-953(+)
MLPVHFLRPRVEAKPCVAKLPRRGACPVLARRGQRRSGAQRGAAERAKDQQPGGAAHCGGGAHDPCRPTATAGLPRAICRAPGGRCHQEVLLQGRGRGAAQALEVLCTRQDCAGVLAQDLAIRVTRGASSRSLAKPRRGPAVALGRGGGASLEVELHSLTLHRGGLARQLEELRGLLHHHVLRHVGSHCCQERAAVAAGEQGLLELLGYSTSP